MSSVQDYRDLRVWQAGMERVERVYRLTDQFPDWENYGVAAQVRRAAVSIPFNIAEGHAQEHLAEYLHHLAIARGSLAEVQTQIEIASRLGYISPDAFQDTHALGVSLAKQLSALRSALARSRR